MEQKYLISDAAREVDVEPHVLRYWEDELGLAIHRNEMGHRFYSESDIKTLRSVRGLKDKGFQLKAIKPLLPQLGKIEALDDEKLLALKLKLDEALGLSIQADNPSPDSKLIENSKMNRFRDIMGSIMQDALIDNNDRLTESITRAVKDNVIKEIDYLFRAKEEQEEERFRRFDRMLREHQITRQQTAAASESYFRKKTKDKRRI